MVMKGSMTQNDFLTEALRGQPPLDWSTPVWDRSVCWWNGMVYENNCPICRGETVRYLPGPYEFCKTWNHPERRDPRRER